MADTDAPLQREARTGLMLTPEMAERYGVRRTNPVVAGVIGVLVTAFVAAVLGFGYRLATPETQSKLLAFRVLSPQKVEVIFEVRRDALDETFCVLRARAVDHTDVGYAQVRITPGRDYVQVVYPLATYAEATSAEVLDCAAGDWPRVDPPGFLPGTTNPPQVPVVDGS
ncbi:MAG: DUF4307 domain-containing protein [Candidatus Nanopelagicales bacterium]